MSIWATTFALDDDGHGRPRHYHGSHILPITEDPRDGSVQLAEIPSHITRDGRDDAPDDDQPWPWARLSIDTADGSADVVLDPGQARALAAALLAWADRAGPGEPAGPR